MWRLWAALVLSTIGAGVEAVRPERDFVARGRRGRDDGLVVIDKAELQRISEALKNGDLETAADSKIQIRKEPPEKSEDKDEEVSPAPTADDQATPPPPNPDEQADPPPPGEQAAPPPANPDEQATPPPEEQATSEDAKKEATTEDANTNTDEATSEDTKKEATTEDTNTNTDEEKAEHEAEPNGAFFQEVANSHEKLDKALEQYKEIADKGEKRAAEVYEKLGDYKASITNLRSPLQQISSQVKQLHSQIVQKLKADEKERMAPLNSLQDTLGKSSAPSTEAKEAKEATEATEATESTESTHESTQEAPASEATPAVADVPPAPDAPA